MGRAWGVLVAGLVQLGAGFLPWSVIVIHKGSVEEQWVFRVWGWTGGLRPLGVPLPNAIVPLVGLTCALLAAATLRGLFRIPWKIPFCLALYAFVHATVGLAGTRRSDCGVGLPLSVAAALAIAVLSWPRKAPADPAASRSA